MRLTRLNKVIEETDPERIREYKRMGFTEEGREPLKTGTGREPVLEKPDELSDLPQDAKTRRGRGRGSDSI